MTWVSIDVADDIWGWSITLLQRVRIGVAILNRMFWKPNVVSILQSHSDSCPVRERIIDVHFLLIGVSLQYLCGGD